jgi:hypothetical protein
MSTTLAPLLRKCILVFFDDILKLSKCAFAQTEISYLGHIISSQGVATYPNKIFAVASWPIPETVKDLRSFLGLLGYYIKFVKHFGIISRPLTDLLKKHTCFVWTTDHSAAFEDLKQALISAPVLSLPNFSKSFIMETDASDKGIGAVLMQEGHPLISLASLWASNRELCPHTKNNTWSYC